MGTGAVVPGSVGMIASLPLFAVLNNDGWIVRYRWPRVDVYEGMSMTLLLRACWSASKEDKFGGSVGVEMWGMSHGCVLNSAVVLSMLGCVCMLFDC